MNALNTKKIALLLLTMFVLSIMLIVPTSATSVSTNTVSRVNTDGSKLGATDISNTSNPAGLPSASIEDLQTKMENKMFNIVTLLQTIGKPFFIVCFLVSLVYTILGWFGRGGVWKGVIGMFLSGILYGCVMYAPEIVQFIQIWFAS